MEIVESIVTRYHIREDDSEKSVGIDVGVAQQKGETDLRMESSSKIDLRDILEK